MATAPDRQAPRAAASARSGVPITARPAPVYVRHEKRSFQAGLTDRLTASWTVADQTLNQSLLKDLRKMRARSRDFYRNNEYGKKFFGLVKANVVGPAGFSLKFDCKNPDGRTDKLDSARLERAFWRWAKRGVCDVTGRLRFEDVQALIILMTARDGEVLIRFVAGKDRGPHRFQLQLLPGHLLDEEHNRDLGDGHRIRMGVEFDRFMRPIAYHLRMHSPNADLHGTAAAGQRYERVPAAEMLHVFVPEEIEQWRGVPWAATALRGARHLDQFEEAALVAANVGAGKMGFFQQKDAEAGPPTSGNANEKGEFAQEVTPGAFDVIPVGYELKDYDPTYPNEVFDPFVKAVLRKLSTGLGASYHSLSGDLTQVSFSSIRAGTLDERDQWKFVQGWMIGNALEPIIEAWLAHALLYDDELAQLPYTKFDKFNAPIFGGRRWDWVDPKGDMAAEREAVGLRIKSRAQIIRERGGDPDQVWEELEAEEARGMTAPARPGDKPAAADADDNDAGEAGDK